MSYVARRTGQLTIIAYIFTGIVLSPVFLDVVTRGNRLEVAIARQPVAGLSAVRSYRIRGHGVTTLAIVS